ncbi:hypothetical protein GN956_G19271 [Arapaima gigas]
MRFNSQKPHSCLNRGLEIFNIVHQNHRHIKALRIMPITSQRSGNGAPCRRRRMKSKAQIRGNLKHSIILERVHWAVFSCCDIWPRLEHGRGPPGPPRGTAGEAGRRRPREGRRSGAATASSQPTLRSFTHDTGEGDVLTDCGRVRLKPDCRCINTDGQIEEEQLQNLNPQPSCAGALFQLGCSQTVWTDNGPETV